MAGQQVSIAVINLNSNIPTFVVGEEVIQASTPGLVTMAEEIASSQDLSDKVAAFVGISSTSTTPPSTSPTSSAKVVGTSKVLLIVLLFLPLALVI